jgi:U3 small nucleolar RNA-associated protein 19
VEESTTKKSRSLPKKRKIEKDFSSRSSMVIRDQEILSLAEHNRQFQNCWLKFLSMNIPSHIYRLVLQSVQDKIIPFMTEPLILMDWLSDSFALGGENAILSLNGLFTLIVKYNLDYPDFYSKLYSLLSPAIFQVTYMDEFFKHLKNFLSSSMLPVYLSTAFIKKLSRLALVAPPSFSIQAIPLIYNLIIDNPATLVLLHRVPKSNDDESQLLKLDEQKIYG